jgi:hypothetical protein
MTTADGSNDKVCDAEKEKGGRSDSAKYCTCENLDCPLHPTKHDKGCTPCIMKNLRLQEVPNCFFNKIEGSAERSGDIFKDFAEFVLNKA